MRTSKFLAAGRGEDAVLAASDVSGPWSGNEVETVFTSTGNENTNDLVTVTDVVPLAAQPRRFLRLVVTR